jgi:hypothetical protein
VYQNTYGIYQPYAVRTITGTKPDQVFGEDLGPHNNPSTNPPEALVLLSNASTGSFPGCGVTGMAEGIRICAPGASASSPVNFSLGAAGPTAMRIAAVWVDGKKVTEQRYLAEEVIHADRHGLGWELQCSVIARRARLHAGEWLDRKLAGHGAGDCDDYRDTGAHGGVGGWSEEVHGDQQQDAEYFHQPCCRQPSLHYLYCQYGGNEVAGGVDRNREVVGWWE